MLQFNSLQRALITIVNVPLALALLTLHASPVSAQSIPGYVNDDITIRCDRQPGMFDGGDSAYLDETQLYNACVGSLTRAYMFNNGAIDTDGAVYYQGTYLGNVSEFEGFVNEQSYPARDAFVDAHERWAAGDYGYAD